MSKKEEIPNPSHPRNNTMNLSLKINTSIELTNTLKETKNKDSLKEADMYLPAQLNTAPATRITRKKKTKPRVPIKNSKEKFTWVPQVNI